MRESKRWIRIVRCEDIPLREGRAVTVGHREIAIFNLGDRFLAVNNRCPHRGGPLADGILCGSTVVCPLHAWKFSLETGSGISSASASSCIETFATRAEDGIVSVEMPIPRVGQERTEEAPALCAVLTTAADSTSA